MFKPDHFKLYELVPENYYNKYGEKCWQLLDVRALMVIDAIRRTYGPMKCNTWINGGNRTQSGLRVQGQKYYKPRSQHSFGRAFDLISTSFTAEEIRSDLKDSGISKLGLPDWIDSITFEDNVSWIHVDVRNNSKGLNFFNP